MNRTDPTTTADAAPDRNGPPPATLRQRVQSLRLKAGGGSARPPGALLPWGLTVIAVAAAAAFGWRTYRLRPADDAARAPAAPGATAAAPQGPGDAASSGGVALEAKGYVIASHQIQVSPEVNGKLVWINNRFEEGAHFKQGEVLAIVDPVLYGARRDRAAATVAEAERVLEELTNGSRPQEIAQGEARLARARATLDEKQAKSRRVEETARGGAGVVRPEELDEVRAAAAQAKADLDDFAATLSLLREGPRREKIGQAEARVQLARADLADALKQFDSCYIRAPVTGTVLTKKAELGNYVNPVGFNVSASLCEMADLREVEIDLSIQERDVARVEPGQPVLVMPEAYQRHAPFLKAHPDGYEGVVSRLMPIADRGKGAIPVRVKVVVPEAEAGRYLKPDLGVVVSFKKAAK